MKLKFAMLLLLPSMAFAQSQGAIEACRDINPPVVWRECITKYEAREKELREDPQYQAEQERIRKEQQMRAEELRIQRFRAIQELQRRQTTNCTITKSLTGNTYYSTCN